VATLCSNCGALLDAEAPGDERRACPECGSTARTHEVEATFTARASVSATASVERGLNELRLAVLGILVGIGLTVGFGVQGAWWVRTAAGAGAFALSMALLRWRASRHRLMAAMHWLTGG
jgi:uncharacterized membrane protein YedE/YeeE